MRSPAWYEQDNDDSGSYDNMDERGEDDIDTRD